ncbi:hypothetical protein [Fodinicola feengrottensis]|uniref:hypothetical protein n=1 Tax=Fodinicola feengrottensis TaxID=435914 RepID=UPI0013D685AA|nr:hypothetical protein [Fodinicola feengrottensis]
MATHRARQRACWLEIAVPDGLGARQIAGLWRLVAGILPAARWWRLTPRHVSFEVHATRDGLRCGLWLPPSVHADPTSRAITRAWPGAHVTHTMTPQLPVDRPVVGRRLRYRRTAWDPIRDETTLDPHRAGQPGWAPSRNEETHAVFDALMAAGEAGCGLLQIAIISRPSTSQLAVLRRAADPTAPTGLSHCVARLPLTIVRVAVGTMLDIFGPDSPRSAGPLRCGRRH